MANMTEVFDELGGFSTQAEVLRRAFDQSFADPATVIEESGELVLAVRVGAIQCGVRLSEVAGILRCPKIVPLPRLKPGCLGIIGIRGQLHAAYHLGTLLGDAMGASTACRWLVLTPGRDALAFVFDTIDACLTIKPEELRAVERSGEVKAHTRAVFVRDGTVRELLEMPALVALATGGAQSSRSEESS